MRRTHTEGVGETVREQIEGGAASSLRAELPAQRSAHVLDVLIIALLRWMGCVAACLKGSWGESWHAVSAHLMKLPRGGTALGGAAYDDKLATGGRQCFPSLQR